MLIYYKNISEFAKINSYVSLIEVECLSDQPTESRLGVMCSTSNPAD